MAEVPMYDLKRDENRRLYLEKVGNGQIDTVRCYKSPQAIIQFLNDNFELKDLPEERLYELAFDDKLHLVGGFEVSRGSASQATVTPDMVYDRALLIGARSIVLVHNHPSGDEEPSKEDMDIEKKIKKSGEMLGIILLDFMICGQNGYYSFVSHMKL